MLDPDPDDTAEAVEVGQLVGGEVERAMAYRELEMVARGRLVDARRRAAATTAGGVR